MTIPDPKKPLVGLIGEELETDQPPDALERIEQLEKQVAKLQKINAALINRVEQNADHQGNSFSLFQTAILLEKQVGDRTQELQQALSKLEQSNRSLSDAKEEADRAHNRLSEAIESLSEGFSLFDADDRLVVFNSRFRSLFPILDDLIISEPSFADLLDAAYERGVLRRPRQIGKERLVLQHEGRERAREPIILALSDGRWIQVSERLTQHGETVGIYTDVTEIKKTEARRRERALEEKSLQLTTTLDNLVQGVSVIDADRRFAYWNSRFLRLMGLPPGFVREGMLFDAVLDSDFISSAFPGSTISVDLVKASRPEFQNSLFRTEYRRQDGLVVEVQRKAMPDGGVVSTYTDVTDNRLAAKILEDAKDTLEKLVVERTCKLTVVNKQLRMAKALADKANLSKTQFLAAASHDLLQPLNAARLFISAFPESDVPAEARRLVGRVNTALDSVDELLKALFDISKLDTGEPHLEWSEFSVQGLLEALAQDYGYLAEEKGLALRVVKSNSVIRSDMLLLRRILQNFIANAIRYTTEGRILLGCRRRNTHLSIQVWDSGPGIPQEHRNKIFDEFQRFVPPGSHTESGFGLGLAIAQRSAKLLGCQIEVSSEVGRGSVFSVEVPYGQPSGHTAPPKVVRPHQVKGAGNATIVFIENDKANLEAMTVLLTKWAYRVICAESAGEARSEIDEHRIVPDLIIADYHLDRGTIGLDAIAQIREHCGLPIPGFIVTADHSSRVQEATKRAGYELLQKPIKPAQLRSLMGHTLT